MILKCIVSSVNIENKSARVILPSSNLVTPDFKIADYVRNVQVRDSVLVAFLNNNMAEGVIIANLNTGSDSSDNNADKTYIHEQLPPSESWYITHNLNKYPSVAIVDSAGTLVWGDIQYISPDEIKINFTAAFSGKAYLN